MNHINKVLGAAHKYVVLSGVYDAVIWRKQSANQHMSLNAVHFAGGMTEEEDDEPWLQVLFLWCRRGIEIRQQDIAHHTCGVTTVQAVASSGTYGPLTTQDIELDERGGRTKIDHGDL